MLPEAEDLLSDICRFYSEDQWLELSAPSYALLAECQRSLELEDQYPSTTVLYGEAYMYNVLVAKIQVALVHTNCTGEGKCFLCTRRI